MVVFVKQVVESQDWGANAAASMSDKPLASFDQQEDFSVSDSGCLPRGRRAALLSKVVAAEILPRLAQVRRGMNDVNPPQEVTTETDTLELVGLLLDHGDPDVTAFVEALRMRGANADSLYIGILSDAARHLGELWTADRCDFIQVTVGLGRLQQVARHLSPSFQVDATRRSAAASILLMPAPGEQHTFGLLILSEFFHRAGWNVSGGPVSKGFDAAATVRRSWFDVAGFSIGSEERVGVLAQTIGQLRRASRNAALIVMVGGPLFLARPGLVAQVGADMTAEDAPGAVRQANEYLKKRLAGG